jgi:hypothetical protein
VVCFQRGLDRAKGHRVRLGYHRLFGLITHEIAMLANPEANGTKLPTCVSAWKKGSGSELMQD